MEPAGDSTSEVAKIYARSITPTSRLTAENIVVVQDEESRPETVDIGGRRIKNEVNPYGLVFEKKADGHFEELQDESVYSDVWKKLWAANQVDIHEWPAFKALSFFAGAAEKANVLKSGILNEDSMKVLENERRRVVETELSSEQKRKKVNFAAKKVQVDEIMERLSLLRPYTTRYNDQVVEAAKCFQQEILEVLQILLDSTLIEIVRNMTKQFQPIEVSQLYGSDERRTQAAIVFDISNDAVLAVTDFYSWASRLKVLFKGEDESKRLEKSIKVLKNVANANELNRRVRSVVGNFDDNFDGLFQRLNAAIQMYVENQLERKTVQSAQPDNDLYSKWLGLLREFAQPGSLLTETQRERLINALTNTIAPTDRNKSARKIAVACVMESIILRGMQSGIADIRLFVRDDGLPIVSKPLSYNTPTFFDPLFWLKQPLVDKDTNLVIETNLTWAFPSFLWFMFQFAERRARRQEPRPYEQDFIETFFAPSVRFVPDFDSWKIKPNNRMDDNNDPDRVPFLITNAYVEGVKAAFKNLEVIGQNADIIDERTRREFEESQLKFTARLERIWTDVLALAREIELQHIRPNEPTERFRERDEDGQAFSIIGTAWKRYFKGDEDLFVEAVSLWLVFCRNYLHILYCDNDEDYKKTYKNEEIADQLIDSDLYYDLNYEKLESMCIEILNKPMEDNPFLWILQAETVKEFIARRTALDMRVISESLWSDNGIGEDVIKLRPGIAVKIPNPLQLRQQQPKKRKRSIFLDQTDSTITLFSRTTQYFWNYQSIAYERADAIYKRLFSFDSVKDGLGVARVAALSKTGIRYFTTSRDEDDSDPALGGLKSIVDITSNTGIVIGNGSFWKIDVNTVHSLLALFQQMSQTREFGQLLPFVRVLNFDNFNQLCRFSSVAKQSANGIFQRMYGTFVDADSGNTSKTATEVWFEALQAVWPESNLFVLTLELLSYVQQEQPKIQKAYESLLSAKESAERELRAIAEGKIELQVRQIARESLPSIFWVLEPTNSRVLIIADNVKMCITNFYNHLRATYPDSFRCKQDAFMHPIGSILTEVCQMFMTCAGKLYKITARGRQTDRDIAIAQSEYVFSCDILIKNWYWDVNKLPTPEDGYSRGEIDFLSSLHTSGCFVRLMPY